MIKINLPEKFGKFIKKEIHLERNNEFRIQYNFVKFIYLKLLSGKAEIMGA